MVSGISVVAYDDHFGFLGLYICAPEARGQGYGRAIWNAGMARLGARTVGLDGVPAQQDNYRRMGFVRQYETIRMSGVLEAQSPHSCEIVSTAPASSLFEIDRACFPAERKGFLELWIAPPRNGINGKPFDYEYVRL